MLRYDLDELTDEEKAIKKYIEYTYVILYGFSFLKAKVVYNDTDSSMISMDVDLDYNLKYIGHLMEVLISGEKEIDLGFIKIPEIQPVFPPPLKMEFEDVTQMVPIKPKYYLKAIRETDREKIKKNGEFEMKDGKPIVKKKGVLTAKRGNSIFSMEVYQDLADKVLFLKPLKDTLYSLADHMKKLMYGKYTARDLIKITELGSNYKVESYYMNIFANNLKKWGKQVSPGDRIEYIIVKTKKELEEGKDEKIGMKCREIEMWEQDENREPLDYQYYAEKGLQKQYDDLFRVGYQLIILNPILKDMGYKPIFSRCHFVHFSTPIKMIAAMIKDLMKPNDEAFERYLNENFDCDFKYERYYYIGKIISLKLKDMADYIEELNEEGKFKREDDEQLELSDSDDEEEI